NPQTWLVLQRLMEQEQQPDMADLLQPRDRLAAVEWRQQFQHATGGRRQARLTRNGELLPEAGAQIADRLDVMGHGGWRLEVGREGDVAIIPDGAARKGADHFTFRCPSESRRASAGSLSDRFGPEVVFVRMGDAHPD